MCKCVCVCVCVCVFTHILPGKYDYLPIVSDQSVMSEHWWEAESVYSGQLSVVQI